MSNGFQALYCGPCSRQMTPLPHILAWKCETCGKVTTEAELAIGQRFGDGYGIYPGSKPGDFLRDAVTAARKTLEYEQLMRQEARQRVSMKRTLRKLGVNVRRNASLDELRAALFEYTTQQDWIDGKFV